MVYCDLSVLEAFTCEEPPSANSLAWCDETKAWSYFLSTIILCVSHIPYSLPTPIGSILYAAFPIPVQHSFILHHNYCDPMTASTVSRTTRATDIPTPLASVMNYNRSLHLQNRRKAETISALSRDASRDMTAAIARAVSSAGSVAATSLLSASSISTSEVRFAPGNGEDLEASDGTSTTPVFATALPFPLFVAAGREGSRSLVVGESAEGKADGSFGCSSTSGCRLPNHSRAFWILGSDLASAPGN